MSLPNTILAALLLGATLPACTEKKTSAGTPEGFEGELQRREAPRVRVSPVEQREMVRTLSIMEPIESEREIEVFPRVSGVVAEVLVEVGDRVEEGQVLAVLDKREAEAAEKDALVALREAQESLPLMALATKEAAERVERAKLMSEQAKTDFERNENTGLISRNELDQMRLTMNTTFRDFKAAQLGRERAAEDEKRGATTIDRAQLALDLQRLNLSYTEIRAPFAGSIAARTVKVGDSVSTSASLFRLTDADNLRVQIHRPQRELAFFGTAARAGAEAGGHEIEIRAQPEAMPDEEYVGEILFLTPTIDAGSGSFGITIGIEQPPEGASKPRLMPGMTVRLVVVTERHPDALVVPKRALRREGDSHFVFLVRDGKAQRVAVREGFSSDADVEILPHDAEALAAGDLAIVVGNRDLEDGTEVNAEPWDEVEARAAPARPEVASVDAGAADGADADLHADTETDASSAAEDSERPQVAGGTPGASDGAGGDARGDEPAPVQDAGGTASPASSGGL